MTNFVMTLLQVNNLTHLSDSHFFIAVLPGTPKECNQIVFEKQRGNV